MKEINPYQSPPQASGYYAEDVTALPVSRLWHMAKGLGVVGVLIVLPIFLFRRIFHLPFAVNHATRRITNLSEIREAEVPVELRESFAPFEEACRKAGMAPAIHVRPPWIGGKWGFFSAWLDSSGQVHASIAAVHLRMGQMQRSKIMFSCHSRLKSGTDLHTAAPAPKDWIPEMVPPGCEPLILDETTPPEEVIARHRARISHGADVVSFTNETLEGEIIRSTDTLFDFLIAKRIYVPVSLAEVDRLRR
jgi:hypothetical protein